MSTEFFNLVVDALGGFVPPELSKFRAAHWSRGVKVWFASDDSADVAREHYEAQFLTGGVVRDLELRSPALEIGFHAEHKKEPANEAVLARLVAREKAWRKALGREPAAGAFLGDSFPQWRRLSEVWQGDRGLENLEAAIEVAERLGDYITVLEPVRRQP